MSQPPVQSLATCRTGLRVLVIGAGPAGLMAAETLATAGHSVTILERMPSPARKLLMAGRGGLNLTHSEPEPAFTSRYGDAAPQLLQAIAAFPPTALRAWADGLGAETFVGSSGRVFPRAMKASPLLRAWLRRLDGLGVTLETGARWVGFASSGGIEIARADGGADLRAADAIILALGGASWPRLGCDGAWTAILDACGVAIAPLRPSNAGLTFAWSGPMRAHAGEPLKRIAVSVDGGTAARGEAMITSAGLEGGAVYAVFRQARERLAAGAVPVIGIDLRPDLGLAELTSRLSRPRGKQSMASFLRRAAQLSPAAVALLREAEPGQSLPVAPEALAARIKHVALKPTGTAGLERAISTAGGVAFSAVDAGLMLKARPGVFVCGEMLDWEAPTGGYLLQASLATAVLAARSADAWLRTHGEPHEGSPEGGETGSLAAAQME